MGNLKTLALAFSIGLNITLVFLLFQKKDSIQASYIGTNEHFYTDTHELNLMLEQQKRALEKQKEVLEKLYEKDHKLYSILKNGEPINQNTKTDSINILLWQFEGLKEFSLTTRFETNFVKGDFYGDGIEDIAALVEKGDQVGLCILNQNDSASYYLFGDDDHIDDYRWAGVFEKVSAGDTLWSNYEEDFRAFKEVSDSEKVVLNYDALFLHAQESCGGGFIFWKDNKFNWLQQE
jgi:hypothetical protein